MGASGWSYFVPYQPDINQALQDLRREVYQKGEYYLLMPKAEMIDYLGNQIREIDEGLNIYEISQYGRESFINWLERLKSLPDNPRTIDEGITEVFAINDTEGTHSIMDIFDIADVPDFGVAAPLTTLELNALLGTDKPTKEMVLQHESELMLYRDRWQGTYIIVYKDDQPNEIFFTGYSGD